ncbi:hypothetical protein K1T71_000246 [Dendrolimus kikuchii]|uniref:Uncharacterized protein n=1 Tax=Dendrolimus kikuchii TaxID=765133 RepID=A0ACC1DJI0_9NEOP|nr:hypothetical protein K1T71_000246 [Dendrolimus kikuchii]
MIPVFSHPESDKRVSKEMQTQTEMQGPTQEEGNSLDTFVVYSMCFTSPITHIPQISDESKAHRFVLRTPRLVTKLAKTFAFGFDPYFSKGYFEPFENRPKPVTLVTFRKNGLAPRRTIKFAEDKSFEIAELQSPYNHISNFWANEPGGVET